jgi:hypothetical protein
MLIATLIVLNIPVYLFIGWLHFDSGDNAADTFFETIVAILKAIFIPASVRVLLGVETDQSWGLFQIAGFFTACVALVYGEHWLLLKCFPSLS